MVIAIFVTPACYTLVKHPKVKRVIYEEVTDRRCLGCHQQKEVWAFHHPPNRRFPSGLGHAAWNRYYSIPWWYNEYWYYDQNATAVPRARVFRDGAGRIPAERRLGMLRSQRGKTFPLPVDVYIPETERH